MYDLALCLCGCTNIFCSPLKPPIQSAICLHKLQPLTFKEGRPHRGQTLVNSLIHSISLTQVKSSELTFFLSLSFSLTSYFVSVRLVTRTCFKLTKTSFAYMGAPTDGSPYSQKYSLLLKGVNNGSYYLSTLPIGME